MSALQIKSAIQFKSALQFYDISLPQKHRLIMASIYRLAYLYETAFYVYLCINIVIFIL